MPQTDSSVWAWAKPKTLSEGMWPWERFVDFGDGRWFFLNHEFVDKERGLVRGRIRMLDGMTEDMIRLVFPTQDGDCIVLPFEDVYHIANGSI